MTLITKAVVLITLFTIAVASSNNTTVNQTTTTKAVIATRNETTKSVIITTTTNIEAKKSTEATTTDERAKETTEAITTDERTKETTEATTTDERTKETTETTTTTTSEQLQSTEPTMQTPPQVITDQNGTLSTEMLIAIISLGMASFGLLVLVGVCVWYKTSKARRMSSFLKVLNDTDESMLYMVDYDDVALNHGRLHLQVAAQPLTPDEEKSNGFLSKA